MTRTVFMNVPAALTGEHGAVPYAAHVALAGRAALAIPQTGSWNHSTTILAPASAMARVCSDCASFLAILLSTSDMATKPRPSSDRPTMTIRLTSSAEPRSFLRVRRRCLFFVIAFTSVTRARIGGGGEPAYEIAGLREARI